MASAGRTAASAPAERRPPRGGNTKRRQGIVDEIKRRIVIGELRPGEHIAEAELTAALEVSRPTVREALNQLARDGYLVQEAYRGHRVSRMERSNLLETAHVRVSLDLEAIAEILADATGERLASLEAAWAAFEAVSGERDPLRAHEAHLAFHRAIWEAADNYLLLRIWPVLEAQMTIALAYDQFARTDPARSHAVHAALMTAIRGRDLQRIREALEVHTVDSARSAALLLPE